MFASDEEGDGAIAGGSGVGRSPGPVPARRRTELVSDSDSGKVS